MEFFYTGNDGCEYGPHSESDLLQWYRDSFLSSTSLIRARRDDGSQLFRASLLELVERNGTANPFLHLEREEEGQNDCRRGCGCEAASRVDEMSAELSRLQSAFEAQGEVLNVCLTELSLLAQQSAARALSERHEASTADELSSRLDSVSLEATAASDRCEELKSRLREVCRFIDIDRQLLKKLAPLTHIPLVQRNQSAVSIWPVNVSELGIALRRLRNKWNSRSFSADRLDHLFKNNFVFNCWLCSDTVSFAGAADMFEHCCAEEHIDSLCGENGPGYSVEDINFWNWVINRLEEREQ